MRLIGLAVIAALKRRGIGPVIAAHYSPARRARRSRRLGADVVVDPATVSPHATSWSGFDVPATLRESAWQLSGATCAMRSCSNASACPACCNR
ncbi:hypothetical protein AB5I41_11205 [Sphingomonas sp. MMS24-JH45]